MIARRDEAGAAQQNERVAYTCASACTRSRSHAAGCLCLHTTGSLNLTNATGMLHFLHSIPSVAVRCRQWGAVPHARWAAGHSPCRCTRFWVKIDDARDCCRLALGLGCIRNHGAMGSRCTGAGRCRLQIVERAGSWSVLHQRPHRGVRCSPADVDCAILGALHRTTSEVHLDTMLQPLLCSLSITALCSSAQVLQRDAAMDCQLTVMQRAPRQAGPDACCMSHGAPLCGPWLWLPITA